MGSMSSTGIRSQAQHPVLSSSMLAMAAFIRGPPPVSKLYLTCRDRALAQRPCTMYAAGALLLLTQIDMQHCISCLHLYSVYVVCKCLLQVISQHLKSQWCLLCSTRSLSAAQDNRPSTERNLYLACSTGSMSAVGTIAAAAVTLAGTGAGALSGVTGSVSAQVSGTAVLSVIAANGETCCGDTAIAGACRWLSLMPEHALGQGRLLDCAVQRTAVFSNYPANSNASLCTLHLQLICWAPPCGCRTSTAWPKLQTLQSLSGIVRL